MKKSSSLSGKQSVASGSMRAVVNLAQLSENEEERMRNEKRREPEGRRCRHNRSGCRGLNRH